MDPPLHSILTAYPWVRIIMVRGVRSLGHLSDPRTNTALCDRQMGGGRWRSNESRFCVVTWKSDLTTSVSVVGDSLIRNLFGCAHLTLIYNYEGSCPLTLATLLVESTARPVLPPTHWCQLTHSESHMIRAHERIEFRHLTTHDHLNLPPTLLTLLLGDPRIACDALLCLDPATSTCDHCNLNFCSTCTHYCAPPLLIE